MTRPIDANALKQMIDFRMWDVDDDYPHDEASNRISEDHAVKKIIDEMPTVDAVPVVMIESRINGLKKMLIDIDSDDVDNIWALRTEIDTLTELLEMWAERKEE